MIVVIVQVMMMIELRAGFADGLLQGPLRDDVGLKDAQGEDRAQHPR